MESIRKIVRNKVVKNGAWLFVLQFANTVLPLLTIPYVTRVLGTAGYGQFSIAYNWITYCQVIVEYGYTLTGARKVAISEAESSIDRLCRAIVCSRALLFSMVFFAMNVICLLFADPGQYLNTMILMTIAFSVVFQMNWLFQGKQQMKFITIVNVAGRVLSAILILLMVKTPNQVPLYCLLYSVTFLFSSFAGLVVAIRRFEIHFKLASLREIDAELREGWPLFTSSALTKVFGSIGITILGIFASDAVVGAYSAIYKIPFILNLCFAPISQALFPYMSQRFAENKTQAIKLNSRLMAVFTGLFLGVCILIVFLRSWVVRLLFGQEYLEFSDLIMLLAPQVVLGITNNFLGVQTLVASGNSMRYSRCVMLNVIVLLIGNFLLCPAIGAYGTALSALFAEAILSVTLILNCCKYVWNKQKKEKIA